MKTVLLLVGILFVIILVSLIGFFNRIGKPVNAALSDAYYHHAWKNKIVYSPMGNWFELGYKELEADPASFTVLSKEFGKDAKTIFWKGIPQQVQHSSFRIDEHSTPKDALHVYYDFDFGDSLMIIEGADPQSYEPFQLNKDLYYYRWGRDNNAVFLAGRRIDVDRKTFTLFNTSLAADSTNLYSITLMSGQVIGTPGAIRVARQAANPGGVPKVIADDYLQLGNAIILSNWKTEFSILDFDHIDSIRVIDERNIVVNNTVLVSDGERMEGVDIASFEVIDRDFMKDKNTVFYDRKKIPLADPATFIPISEDYSKDNKHAFYRDKIIEGVDPLKFTYNYSTGIASDGNLDVRDGVGMPAQK